VKAMDLTQAIYDRRTVRRFISSPVSEEVLSKILEAGTWAPSHGNTQPWEFIVIGSETRKNLADSYRNMMEAGPLKNPALPEERKELIRKFAQDFGGAPVLLAVVTPPPATDLDRYDYPLTAGAVIQNILLAAWEKEIAGVWLSFGISPQVHSILGLENGATIGGILAIGYSDSIPPAQPRISVSDKIRTLP
jgi:nitroreductase